MARPMAKAWRLDGLTVAAALGVYWLCTALRAQPTDAHPAAGFRGLPGVNET
jgi:hypothetical protein